MFLIKESEGMFAPLRQEHLLTGLMRMLMMRWIGSGRNALDFERFISNPNEVRMNKLDPLTQEEIFQRQDDDDRSFSKVLMAIAGKDRTRELSREEFKKLYDV